MFSSHMEVVTLLQYVPGAILGGKLESQTHACFQDPFVLSFTNKQQCYTVFHSHCVCKERKKRVVIQCRSTSAVKVWKHVLSHNASGMCTDCAL